MDVNSFWVVRRRGENIDKNRVVNWSASLLTSSSVGAEDTGKMLW